MKVIKKENKIVLSAETVKKLIVLLRKILKTKRLSVDEREAAKKNAFLLENKLASSQEGKVTLNLEMVSKVLALLIQLLSDESVVKTALHFLRIIGACAP